ncbi:MAG: bifunctional phosphoribosylaminoimidazolecarboxamide formyltransferase/IMP cyclohydrolase [Bacteriovoracaceae bacterium]|nr:bifunctional phosphoribosylaminoimidazolecarboxamide formyltransferase/IMP cyclohydrolase [Bacteriovoracaceae bacterium]
MKQEKSKIKKALISVSDKSGLLELAKKLKQHQVEIISTGGTAKFLEENKIKTTPIQEITGNPEAFGGRMKTISFEIGSALLFRRFNSSDLSDVEKLNIPQIDLVVCNLYPFEKVAASTTNEDELIENIDVGGPTMIRAAAKNYESVTVLTDPSQYEIFINEFEASAQMSFETRKKFAFAAFAKTAKYDQFIVNTFVGEADKQELRYGENPHQKAWLAKLDNTKARGVAGAEVLQGKELSYNNLLDADAAWKCTSEIYNQFPKNKSVSIIKHANPCGAASGTNNLEVLKSAWACDATSAFGGILCFSHELDKECAQWLVDKFIEIVIAPSFSAEALKIFSSKKNVRLLKTPLNPPTAGEMVYRSIAGGMLIQNEDEYTTPQFALKTKKEFPQAKMKLAEFGLCVGKYLKSNAITLVTIQDEIYVLAGAGMGQPNRLDSLKMLAAPRALANQHALEDCILISDAFFPFRDSVEVAAATGIKYIVQPGGSIRDQEVVDACNEFGIAMVFTSERHFRH